MGQNPRQGLQGIHVLVIDCDADVRATVRAGLEPFGALVTTTTAAGTAEATLIADVILCDLEMVEAAGPMFLAALRTKHHSRGRPAPALAFVTAEPLTDARVRAAGFQGYVTRPIRVDELRMAVWQSTVR
jgi:CheY-like chemotaxis protein